MKNIDAQKVKAIVKKRQIMKMSSGLGMFTFEGAFVYLNSILRSSVLFGCETDHNLKLNQVREIERIEEDLMINILQQKVSIHLLYLESGQIPVRFII